MKLRSVSFSDVDLDAIVEAMCLMGHKVTFLGSEDVVNKWLSTSTVLDRMNDVLSSDPQLGKEDMSVGHIWSHLTRQDWVEVSATIADNFESEAVSEADLQRSVQFARSVISGEESLGDILGNPVVFVAALKLDCSEGLLVATLLEALSIVRLVVRLGGEMVWNRVAYEATIPFPRVTVTWRDGKYRLSGTVWSNLKAWSRSRSAVSAARILRSEPKDAGRMHADRPTKQSQFLESEDVATAAKWLGVTVRDVRVNVLRSLLDRRNRGMLLRYVRTEGVDLADILVLGGATALHSHHGLVVSYDGRTLQWPSLQEPEVAGYTFRCDWGLTRREGESSQVRACHHYLRVHYDGRKREWIYTLNSETYLARATFSGMLLSLIQYVVFWIEVHVFRQQHAVGNANDALARVRATGEFVSTAEATTAKPLVSSTMLKALSDRIAISHADDDIAQAWHKCFGDVTPGAEPIREDEQVVVLSYRHESQHVRMHPDQWRYCYTDLAQVAAAHGKLALRVWTDKLASNTRGDALWLTSGVDPYRSAVVVAFNGRGDSIFVDRFWLSLERMTGFRAWGYWVRDDLGQLVRLGDNEYPARTEDQRFLSQILFSPGRADGPLWEGDRLEVIREAAQQLGVKDCDSLWDALTFDFLPRRYLNFDIVDQSRQAGRREVKEPTWSPASDVLLDRELIEKALGFAVVDRSTFVVRRWMLEEGAGSRFVAVQSRVSDDWFCAKVEVALEGGAWRVHDVMERALATTVELEEITAEMDTCEENWDISGEESLV